MKVQKKTAAAASMAALAVLGMTACSSGSDTAASSSSSSSSSSTSASATADPAADLVGTGCAGYAEQVPEGAGSVSGMAMDPVATAASNNPILTTLTAAVSGKLNPGVNLVDTLNGGEFTVIAPTDDAFAKIDAATLEKLKTDAPLLSSILTYHVIPGRLSPAQIAGTHKTVEGQDVVVTGAGEGLKFDDDTSGLVCGGVQTANATVYMVDTVMMPPAGGPAPAGGTAAPAPGAGGAPGAGAGPGGATAVAPGASAGAGPGGAGVQVPGAGANAGPGGAGVQVPGAGANAGPGGASACVNGVCVGAG